MKKIFILLLPLMVACGGSEESTNETTTSTTQETTTTVQDTTTTFPPLLTTRVTTASVDYADSIDKNGFFLYFEEYRTTGYAGNIFLQLRGYWNEAESLTVYFNDNCTIFEEIQYSKTNNSIGTIALNITEIFEEKEECKESSKAVSIKVKQVYDGNAKENPYLNFLEDGKYFIGKINATEDDSSTFCCHDIEFNVLNYYISEILNTPTTTTSTITTSTTTTVPKYIFPTVEFPGCPDSYSMTNSIMNLSIDYTITAGDAEVVEFTFENFDTNNGEDFSNKNIFSSEEAAGSGIILPKTKGEVIGIQTTFTATNQNEKRILKLVVTATDSNGFIGSGECEFVMNPNGEIGQATTTTTTTTTTTIQQNEESNNVGGIPGGLFEISYLNKGFGWNNNNLYTYPYNNQNSKPVALEFLEGNEDNCDSINFLSWHLPSRAKAI